MATGSADGRSSKQTPQTITPASISTFGRPQRWTTMPPACTEATTSHVTDPTRKPAALTAMPLATRRIGLKLKVIVNAPL